MFPNSHCEFILTPITKVLKDAVSASSGVGGGIETFPLYDYVMQSLFLKMTGFQEQKMKCICWDIATIDYEYRYDFTKNPLGECSTYKEKNSIYVGILKQIKKHGIGLSGIGLNRIDIWQTTLDEVEDIFLNTNLSIWAQQNFNNFKKDLSSIRQNHFVNQETVCLRRFYMIFMNIT